MINTCLEYTELWHYKCKTLWQFYSMLSVCDHVCSFFHTFNETISCGSQNGMMYFYVQSLIHNGAKNVQTFYKLLSLSLLHDKSVTDER